ncbi:MAG: alpha-glucan family phosphorylase [Candidatus Coatesbacteria bacterium]|nr:alpha-glucan family phosphorylase [Candidatus Coatesbacteria bacterium]
MENVRIFNVIPSLPERLSSLRKIAYNTWFSWHPETIRLFRRINPKLWESTNHNPVLLLGQVSQSRLEELLNDEGFLRELDDISEEFDRYVNKEASYNFRLERPIDGIIAYFSMEYGLSDCLNIYSGGLGILSGDHMKSASDLGVPIVGVGLLYRQGYFTQYLSADGWQQEFFPENDIPNQPIMQEKDKDGKPIEISIELKESRLKAYVWRVQIGSIPLYLLDSYHPENPQSLWDITAQLYAGDREMRLQQEILLGIGGVRAFKALGYNLDVVHMNEGHSAFVVLERIRTLMVENGLSYKEAKELVFATTCFTTHTPIPAGNEVFDRWLIEAYFNRYINQLGISMWEFLSYGRINPANEAEQFCMTVLAIKFSAYKNGVSQLHAKISRQMWKDIWPHIPQDDVPIIGITNGIHVPTWISSDMASLFDRYLGPRWSEDPDNQRVWERVIDIPDSELWRTHERRRERLIAFARTRLVEQLKQRGSTRTEQKLAEGVLNPEALTIGFARRFIPYKRGDLVFRDIDRLIKILTNQEKPVQIIFAGKAHPRDNYGKQIIKNIIQYSRKPELRDRVVFIENYDMNVARYMVQGVDIWLNNPRRPQEACGTSGMKASANGAINFSVLDGWWCEAYQTNLGWAVGQGEEYQDINLQDDIESNAIYTLLEKEVIPIFYDRGSDQLPRRWIQRMKSGLRAIVPVFNTHRMVEDYVERAYYQAAMNHKRLVNKKYAGIREFTKWKENISRKWQDLKIIEVESDGFNDRRIGSKIKISVKINLGDIHPSDINVDLYYGHIDSARYFLDHKEEHLAFEEQKGNEAIFSGGLICETTGKFGIVIRILPNHENLVDSISSGLILWG